eukprot:149978-Amphidinium_carterae.1
MEPPLQFQFKMHQRSQKLTRTIAIGGLTCGPKIAREFTGLTALHLAALCYGSQKWGNPWVARILGGPPR